MATNRLSGSRCVSTQRASGVSFWTHIEAERVREEERERERERNERGQGEEV